MRNVEIERANRILLEKMSAIMSKAPEKAQVWRKPSMNREWRRRELMKISLANQHILRRLQGKRPTFSVDGWEQSFREHQRYQENISEAPYQYGRDG